MSYVCLNYQFFWITYDPFDWNKNCYIITCSGEYTIPKGTQVWTNLHELLHDVRHWKDPHKFDPSRFLDTEGKFTGITQSFKPFGTGRRVCIGESLAKSELSVRICMMLLMLTAMKIQQTRIFFLNYNLWNKSLNFKLAKVFFQNFWRFIEINETPHKLNSTFFFNHGNFKLWSTSWRNSNCIYLLFVVVDSHVFPNVHCIITTWNNRQR